MHHNLYAQNQVPAVKCSYALLTSRHYTACQNSCWSHTYTVSHKIMDNTACCTCYEGIIPEAPIFVHGCRASDLVMMSCTASGSSTISAFLSRKLTCTLGSLSPKSCTNMHRQPLPSVYLELGQCSWMVHMQCGLA